MKESELEQRIDKLEEKLFLLDMIDTWEAKDYEYYGIYFKELKEAKQQLSNFKEKPKQKPHDSNNNY